MWKNQERCQVKCWSWMVCKFVGETLPGGSERCKVLWRFSLVAVQAYQNRKRELRMLSYGFGRVFCLCSGVFSFCIESLRGFWVVLMCLKGNNDNKSKFAFFSLTFGSCILRDFTNISLKNIKVFSHLCLTISCHYVNMIMR